MESNRSRADRIAVERAAERLAGVDLRERCDLLGLDPPKTNGTILIRAYGRDILLAPPEFTATDAGTGTPAHPVDRLLVLHYLLCVTPPAPGGPLLTFRDLPGGQFYWEPFRSRTVVALAATIGDGLDLLRSRLARLDSHPFDKGDVGARVRCIGNLWISLAYYAGDTEFPPSAEIFFDAAVRHAQSTEDAAAMAQRLCGLLRT